MPHSSYPIDKKRCLAEVRDKENGQRFNIIRVYIVPLIRQCRSKPKPGSEFCGRHQNDPQIYTPRKKDE